MAARKVWQTLYDGTFRPMFQYTLDAWVTISASDTLAGSAWVYVCGDGTTAETVFNIKGDVGSARCCWLAFNASGSRNVQITRSRSTSSKFLRSLTNKVNFGWNHIAFVIGVGAISDTKIWVNGALAANGAGTPGVDFDAASTAGSGTFAALPSGSRLLFMAGEDAAANSMGAGAFANVGIWKNRDITSDITELSRQAGLVNGVFVDACDPNTLSTGTTGLIFAPSFISTANDPVSAGAPSVGQPSISFLDDLDSRSLMYGLVSDFYAVQGVKDNAGAAIVNNNAGGTVGGTGAVKDWVDWGGGRNSLTQATQANRAGFMKAGYGLNRGRFSELVTFGAPQNSTISNVGDTTRQMACASMRLGYGAGPPTQKLAKSRFTVAAWGTWALPCGTGTGAASKYQQTIFSCPAYTIAIGTHGSLTYVDAENAAGVAHTTTLAPACTPSLVCVRGTANGTVKIRAHHTEQSVARTYTADATGTSFKVGWSQSSNAGCNQGLHRLAIFSIDVGDSAAAGFLNQGTADFQSFPTTPTRCKWEEGSSSRKYYWDEINLGALLVTPSMPDALGYNFARGGDDILGGGESDLEYSNQYLPIDETLARFSIGRGYVQIGSNDTLNSEAKTLAQNTTDVVYGIGGNGGIADWTTSRKAASASLKKLGVMTLLPRLGDDTASSATQVSSTEFFNRIDDIKRELLTIIGTNGIDAVLAAHSILALYYDGAFNDATYYNGDKTHLNQTGQLLVQTLIDDFLSDGGGNGGVHRLIKMGML